MTRFFALLVSVSAMVGLAACSGSSSPSAAPASRAPGTGHRAPVTTSSTATVAAVDGSAVAAAMVETSLEVAGGGAVLEFTLRNDGAGELPVEWARFVLATPAGVRVGPHREASEGGPVEVVPGGGFTYQGGAIFRDPMPERGRYVVSYGGVEVASTVV